MGIADWIVVAAICAMSLAIGLFFTRRAEKQGASGYFTGNRSLPWWAIGLSNTATYSSGNGAFVMLVLVFGITGNWMWWAAWIVWMPLVAIIWARMWRRMQIVTTAELITLRYGGKPALLARKVYAFLCFCIAVIIIGYITGFFAKTIAPLVPLTEAQILLIFGGVAVIYTIFGGLIGVVFTDVVLFFIFFAGNLIFLLAFAIPQLGGWLAVTERVQSIRPEAFQQFPPTGLIPLLTIGMLVLQGLFFAGSPTAGEGMTAQRFMGAKNERHAMGGQLFNSFLALSLRTFPLIGLGVLAVSIFWTHDLIKQVGAMPMGMKLLKDPAYAWGELINACRLPPGYIGVLVAAEAAGFMASLSALINWGTSFIVNDYYRAWRPHASPRTQVLVSRLMTLFLFIFAALIAIFFVKGMVSWFLFINSVMVIFILPLSWYRFFWWRFNVWGELAAIILGLPLSILFWFILGFQHKPFWQSTGLLFLLSLITLALTSLLTPPESEETLIRFYERCRPPGLWKRIKEKANLPQTSDPTLAHLLADCLIGTISCLALVVMTNAVFAGSWDVFSVGLFSFVLFGYWLIRRILVAENKKTGEAPKGN